MKAAKIENGVVTALWEVPSLDCYGDLYTLVEAPDWVQLNATYDGTTFSNPASTAPVPLTKEQKVAIINAQRDAKLAAGFTFNGALYHCDEVFGSQLQAFVLAWQTGILPADATVSIRRKDNVTVQMGRDEVMALAAALMQYVQQVYAESWAAKDALG